MYSVRYILLNSTYPSEFPIPYSSPMWKQLNLKNVFDCSGSAKWQIITKIIGQHVVPVLSMSDSLMEQPIYYLERAGMCYM